MNRLLWISRFGLVFTFVACSSNSPNAPDGTGSGGTTSARPPLVTSEPGAYWKTDAMLTESTGTATVTVNDTQAAQTWEGFGGAFNELGWSVLTTQAMKDQALKLLFSSTDGAA